MADHILCPKPILDWGKGNCEDLLKSPTLSAKISSKISWGCVYFPDASRVKPLTRTSIVKIWIAAKILHEERRCLLVERGSNVKRLIPIQKIFPNILPRRLQILINEHPWRTVSDSHLKSKWFSISHNRFHRYQWRGIGFWHIMEL